ncbi:UNVERIFIED_CONTAM: protein BOBBER 1 [Sesamum radiatum]|uniref:Protein BOBBER 1 n=1 Tax=Sesamum radiatum TaxID=300843 RepID=A0AAW2KDR1_SESRA
MAILSDYEEEDHKEPSSSAAPARKPFNSALDPSDPLGFLEKVFEFVAKESDLFKSDSLVADVNAVVRMVKDKVEGEEKKRKEGKVEAGKVEKKSKEVAAPLPPKKEEVKEDVMEENGSGSKAEEEKGPRGTLFNFC